MIKNKVSLIAAHDLNGLIGSNNGLPWSLPNDLKFFKDKTLNKTILMGSNTMRSLPNGKPLPKRTNLVLTSKPETVLDGFIPFTLEDIENYEDDIMVIGGKQIYETLFPYVSTCYITRIENEFVGDTYLNLDLTDFILKESIVGTVDDNNKHKHTFLIYER